jgi:hypothetical protein
MKKGLKIREKDLNMWGFILGDFWWKNYVIWS